MIERGPIARRRRAVRPACPTAGVTRMKLIVAIIQPDKLDEVHQALIAAEIFRVTVSRVTGHGQQEDPELYRGEEVAPSLIPKVRLEIAVNDAFVDADGRARSWGSAERGRRHDRRRQDLRHAARGVHPDPHRRAWRRRRSRIDPRPGFRRGRARPRPCAACPRRPSRPRPCAACPRPRPVRDLAHARRALAPARRDLAHTPTPAPTPVRGAHVLGRCRCIRACRAQG